MLKYKEETPIDYCTFERLERLKQAGFDTDGHIDQLRDIIVKNGYPLPSQEGEHYGFIFMQKKKKKKKKRVDAFAELILMLKEYKMI